MTRRNTFDRLDLCGIPTRNFPQVNDFQAVVLIFERVTKQLSGLISALKIKYRHGIE